MKYFACATGFVNIFRFSEIRASLYGNSHGKTHFLSIYTHSKAHAIARSINIFSATQSIRRPFSFENMCFSTDFSLFWNWIRHRVQLRTWEIKSVWSISWEMPFWFHLNLLTTTIRIKFINYFFSFFLSLSLSLSFDLILIIYARSLFVLESIINHSLSVSNALFVWNSLCGKWDMFVKRNSWNIQI